MAIFQRSFTEDFESLLERVERIVLNGSASASLEEKADYRTAQGCRCSIRVFERYSYSGGNRVSMSVPLFQAESGKVELCATTSGGSQALFFKLNTWGEEAFLDTLKDAL